LLLRMHLLLLEMQQLLALTLCTAAVVCCPC
jgi:hypothetical protein